ncbi:hypothetical protein FUAX_28010 [Fulvitalea axinellae]|uniref:HTH araC/xylS-type domain-containing protein n=1 Tax=Fulvitalea axinellae TaxID=1182444 RepID=A0AAU9D766_9BACT|nr:hypothetical protein FUAX_28010 [Fulvitalea axinellae]
MILNDFPDINFVRKLRNEQSPDFQPGSNGIWPNVIIHAQKKEIFRKDIVSPLSLFMNIKGESHCTTEGRKHLIGSGEFLLVNPDQRITLEIDNPTVTETFNIHINTDFLHGNVRSLISSDDELLNEKTNDVQAPLFHNQLYPKPDNLRKLSDFLIGNFDGQTSVTSNFSETLSAVIDSVYSSHRHIAKKIEKLPATKAYVRREVYRRLAIATDYIRSNYSAKLNLDKISMEAGLSKFHFLRLFKNYFGLTPAKFLNAIRMEKASEMLRSSDIPVAEVATLVGFDSVNSFIKSFNRHSQGISPNAFRNMGK